jgi:hypothetical protein
LGTVVYAGHHYVEQAMAFARVIDPGNPGIDLQAFGPVHPV